MPVILEANVFLKLAARYPVLDVRSPGEFHQGHIPGAFNLPLFDNEERAEIGTLYVRSGRDVAIRQGMELVGKKFGHLIGVAEEIAPGKQILIHCWRGGMRSESLAWFFEKLGYEVYVLKGGYKAYRRYIREAFTSPHKMILIGGYTGSGKTELLGKISNLGEQCIDLEALASHKGSVFGHLGQQEQPTTEQFENDLYLSWSSANPDNHLWVEHESNRIGNVFLPETFYSAMLGATLLKVNLPVEIRVQRLITEYAGFDKSLLKTALERIRTEMGTQNHKEALLALNRDDFETMASIMLVYYDKTYEFALKKRPVRVVHAVNLVSTNMEENAKTLLEFVSDNEI